jgi:asparagine synthase (glutamine-hydrolysing)
MSDLMAHRGHGSGSHTVNGLAVSARWPVKDGRGDERQPLSIEDGNVICVCDGEIYNVPELRKQFGSGVLPPVRSGVDVIPQVYRSAPLDFERHLRGKFAIFLWDAQRAQAVLVRDRLGTKPLYYATVKDGVVFGSELKSVLASGLISPELDFEAIDAYLTLGFVPNPRTPLAGVSKLPPGSRLIVDSGGTRLEQYWAFPKPVSDVPPREESQYAEELAGLLEDAVREQLMGDQRPGAVLSGGLDSSLTVALMARNTTQPVKTFTVAFAEAGKYSELDPARYVSTSFGTDHHELELSIADLSVDLEKLIWHLDEPLADLSSLGLIELCEVAAEQVDAAFSGQGSDQLFAGYTKHCAAGLVRSLKRVPGAASAARVMPGILPGDLGRAARMLGARDPVGRLLVNGQRVDPGVRSELARGDLAQLNGRAAEQAIRAHLDGMSDDDPLAAALYLDSQLELVDDMLHYFDSASMASSLEIRMPFMDHRLVELSARIPSNFKARGLRTKHVLRLAARGILPEQVLTSRRKVGFFHPVVDTWFRAQIDGAVATYLLSDDLRCAEFIDQGTLQQMVRGDTRDRPDTYSLFVILMLELWLASYLPRALSQGTAPA